ncbi:hypothetical protein NDN08_007289 [Rhodosorus marinus]|uniref:Uncharacterized protein n=1 Tax=Rhodosorus marinus TaxID=101924 RepID=A0AAV8UG31_9RHOD|nr:hypothetical protein NDN08_007289 [Rhodosorus marinus]
MDCVTTTAGSFAGIRRPIPMNEQVLDNPSFEHVDSKWEFTGRAKLTTKDQYWGDRSLRFIDEGASAKQVVFLKGDTNYRLHCHVKGSIRMSIERSFSSNWPEPRTSKVIYGYNHAETFDEANSATWKNQEIDFFLKNRGEYDIMLERDDGGNPNLQGGGVYADTCTLYKADAVPPYVGSSTVGYSGLNAWTPPVGVQEHRNLFKNPSFEMESSFGWLLEGPREFRANEQLEGEQCLMLYPGGLAEQSFSLVKGQTYEFRCYVFDKCPLVMEIQKSGQVLQTLEEGGPFIPVGQGSWRMKHFSFEAKAGIHFFKIYVRSTSEPCMVDYCAVTDRSR